MKICILAVSFFAFVPLIDAADDDDISSAITDAAKNTDPATAAQVEEFSKANQDTLQQIFRGHRSYLSQLTDLTDTTDGAGKGDATKPRELSLKTSSETTTTTGSGPLRIERLETSGGLNGAHLDGYPALPDVAPTSSILFPTAAQLEHKAEVDHAVEERKRFLMRESGR